MAVTMAHRQKALAELDLEADAPSNQEIKPADMAAVVALADEMLGIDSWLEQIAERVKAKMERRTQIEQVLLPDMMMQIGMKQFALVSGDIVSIKDVVRASIPSQTSIEKADGPERAALEERRNRCLAWLRKNKAEALIKSEITASFGKGQGKAAAKIVKEIVKQGYPARLEETVNHQTLNKFIRESIADGTKVPEEDFALFTGQVASITKPRTKKSK